jgi:hypothetical protein
MKFARILKRGFLDTVSILILAVQGGVQLSSDYLWVLSVCNAVASRPQGRGGAGGMVVQRPVRQQLRVASPAQKTNWLWLWARLGHGGPQLGYAQSP